MTKGTSALLSLLIGFVLIVLALKVAGAVLKIIGLLLAVAIAGAVYFAVQRKIGGGRAR